MEIPPITRVLVIFSILLSLLVYLEIVAETSMFLIRGRETQIWRYFTHLFYYGSLALGPIVKLVITVGIFRRVEEYCFRGRAADYLLFILFTGFFLT